MGGPLEGAPAVGRGPSYPPVSGEAAAGDPIALKLKAKRYPGSWKRSSKTRRRLPLHRLACEGTSRRTRKPRDASAGSGWISAMLRNMIAAQEIPGGWVRSRAAESGPFPSSGEQTKLQPQSVPPSASGLAGPGTGAGGEPSKSVAEKLKSLFKWK